MREGCGWESRRDTVREMEADVLQRSGCFPRAAMLLVNKQKYWSAKYNISLQRTSPPGDVLDSGEERQHPGHVHPHLQGSPPEADGGMDGQWGSHLPSCLINFCFFLSLSLQYQPSLSLFCQQTQIEL